MLPPGTRFSKAQLSRDISPFVNPTHNQPGVPDTSTPGRFGTGALPSGLPGDDPAHPGFPGKVGQ
jgi:hypothetical protein